MKRKDRPYVICHMVTSRNGKVTGAFLRAPECAKAIEQYYTLHRKHKANAFACGRVTMQESFTGEWYPDLSAFAHQKVSRADYIADEKASRYAVAFDRQGSLGWKDAYIHDEDPGYDNAHIIEVLCENVSDSYLAYLRSIGVSYIFAGESEMDLHLALAKLKRVIGINTLLLEGGSVINGAFQRDGLIDELSLVIAPVLAEETDKPLFNNADSKGYILKSIHDHEDAGLWAVYQKPEPEQKISKRIKI